MKYALYTALAFSLFTACTSHKAFKDFKQDADFPAFNKELIINIDGHLIAGYALIANGEAPKETILLIHGYPGNDTSFDIAHALRRAGKNVIHFNARGAWGNQGDYLYSNGLKDIDAIIAYLSQPENIKKLRIQPNNFTLLGRSYGGGIALIQGSLNPKVQKVIAIASVNYGHIMERYQTLGDLDGFKKYMDKQFMIRTDVEAFLQEMLDHKEEFNVVNYKEKIQRKRVLIIEDTGKNDIWLNELTGIEIVKMETDHNFIDKRVELVRLMVDWLE